MGLSGLNIRTENSPVTIYIQHPIPIPAPGEKSKVGLKPLKLTTKVCFDSVQDELAYHWLSIGTKEDEEATPSSRTTG